MIRLKKSKLYKAVCLLFALFFCMSAIVNLTTALILRESDMMTASRLTFVSQFTDIAIDRMTTDIETRLYCFVADSQDAVNIDDALFMEKYSKQNSNIAFEIKTGDGKTVYSNFAYSPEDILERKSDTLAFWVYACPAEDEERYTVDFSLPETVNPNVHDLYSLCVSAGEGLYECKGEILFRGLISFIAFIIFFALLISASGWVKDEQRPAARMLNRVPIEIAAVVTVLLAVLAALFIDNRTESFTAGVEIHWMFNAMREDIIVISSVVFAALALVYAFSVRIKTGTLIGGSLTAHLIRLMKKICRGISGLIKSRPWKSRIFIKTVLCLIPVTAAEIIILVAADPNRFEFLFVIYAFFKLIQVAAVAVAALNFTVLQHGAEMIAAGQTGHKVSGRLLFDEFRKNAEYLNSVNDGINKAVEGKLKSEKMRTELISNVSHDLKTPLTSIINFTGLLKNEKIENEKANEYIEIIDRQSQKLKKLTSDIVEVSKASTGNISVNPEKTDIGVILSQLSGEYEDKLKNKNLELICSQPENDVFIMSDGRLLWRVIDNLMSNICKYALKGSRVYITVEAGIRVKIIFRNISEAQLNIAPEMLTERFVRADESRNTEGSGLGLAIAKSLTELMKGGFDVAVDGDLFKVTLDFSAYSGK